MVANEWAFEPIHGGAREPCQAETPGISFLAFCRASMRTSEVVAFSVKDFWVPSETYMLNLCTGRNTLSCS